MSIEAMSWAIEQQVGDPTRKLLLVVLADYADHYATCWPSQSTLSRRCEISARNIRKHISALEIGGFLVRQRRERDNGQQASDYYLLQMPISFALSRNEPPPVKVDVKEESRKNMVAGLLSVHGPVCWYCGRGGAESVAWDGLPWQVDRILPGIQGGTYSQHNRALSCSACNRKKGGHRPAQWKGLESDADAFGVPLPPKTLAFLLGIPGAVAGDRPRVATSDRVGVVSGDRPITVSKKPMKKTALDAFEQAWRAYPKRSGSNSKPAAEKAFRARVESGVPAQYLVGATLDYAMFCDATGKWGTEFVMMGSTFYGPGLRYDADWSLPGQAKAKAPEQVQDKEESYAGRFV